MSEIHTMLEELYKKDCDLLEVKKEKIKDNYRVYPYSITKTSELLNMPAELLLRSCARAAISYQDITWSQVMEIVRAFHNAVKMIENETVKEYKIYYEERDGIDEGDYIGTVSATTQENAIDEACKQFNVYGCDIITRVNKG